MLLSPIHAEWLAYARTIIGCAGSHRAECERAGGASVSDGIDASLRWPGMLGPDYQRAQHKILCVGQIHLATEWSQKHRANPSSLQPLMRQWLSGEVSDETFYERYSALYAKLLGLWGPWVKAFRPTLEAFGIGPSDVVYTNFARCWQSSGSRVYDAMDCCARTFPIKNLYDIVKPDAVIVLSGASVFRQYPSLMRGLPAAAWQHFPGRRSFAFTSGDIAAMRDWLGNRLGATLQAHSEAQVAETNVDATLEFGLFDDARDSFDALTRLVNAAYAQLADGGLNYAGATQDVNRTRSRVTTATVSFVVRQNGRLVGTICYYDHRRYDSEPAFYGRDDVCHFGQFAVDPSLQRGGIGSRLLDAVEQRALQDRKAELACDTAEAARHLVAMYVRHGFRHVDTHQWNQQNYNSVVLSKRLGVSIRQAQQPDVESIIEIARTTAWNNDQYLETQIRLGRADVACVEEKVVGVIICNEEFFSKPFIWLAVVAPAYRRKGVGALLFSAVERHHKDKRLYSSTNVSNEAMRRFFEARGYEHAGQLEIGPGDVEVFYSVDL